MSNEFEDDLIPSERHDWQVINRLHEETAAMQVKTAQALAKARKTLRRAQILTGTGGFLLTVNLLLFLYNIWE